MSFSAAASFCHRFGTGLHAGADILVLLKSEAKMGSAKQCRAMEGLIEGVKKGEQLHVLMGQNDFFPTLMTIMVRVGETTGKLEYLLFLLSEHYQQQVQLRRNFISAIILPVLQLIFGILVISLLIYIMGILGSGKMADILGFGLSGGKGVLIFWMYLFAFFGSIGACILCFFKNVAGVQNLIPLIYMVPVIGTSIQTITIARFCRGLSIALGSGLEPTLAISLALDSTDSDYYRAAADDVEKAILSGATLSGALESMKILPADFIGRVEIAEHSGTDSESMAYLANEYDERAKIALKIISRTVSAITVITVMLLLIFMIFRIASFIFGAYDNALNDPILPR
ncbi:type II secretion system F family protein [Rubripirellula sp.]|nr:type II secretion system F family protein [Rubripirellula sp.]MDB4749680.1 type II secretion system F family protein [Rubripirellula sp.]